MHESLDTALNLPQAEALTVVAQQNTHNKSPDHAAVGYTSEIFYVEVSVKFLEFSLDGSNFFFW